MPKYTATHTDWNPHQVFPLVVGKYQADAVYIDPMWGIAIVKVTADGQPVPAEHHPARLDDVNFAKTPIGPDPFVYLVRRNSLVVAESFAETREYKLAKYSIPPAAKLVVIEYRLRESPTGLGPVSTLESKLT